MGFLQFLIPAAASLIGAKLTSDAAKKQSEAQAQMLTAEQQAAAKQAKFDRQTAILLAKQEKERMILEAKNRAALIEQLKPIAIGAGITAIIYALVK